MAEIAIPIAGIAVSAAATLAKPVVDLLTEKYKAGKDPLSLADLHEVLNYGLERLLAIQKDNDNEVLRNMIEKDRTYVYKYWEERVSNIKDQVDSLNKEYDEKKHRQSLEKEMKSALSNVIKLLGEEYPKKILDDKLPDPVIKEPDVPSIEEYRTLKQALQDILNSLQSKGVKCVALHGQKGVGKTTIMQHLNNHFYDNSVDEKLKFDMVIFIKVAADDEQTDVHILEKIADRIKVGAQVNESEVARRIQKALEGKRYLLILDGIGRPPDGIWRKLDISKHKKDSKVVIATHYPLALESRCFQRKIELKALSPEEAWEMFRDIVGKNHLPPTARQVCQRFCCCLPLLIKPIASTFKNEAPTEWGTRLNQWTPWPQVGVHGMEEFYSILESCYNALCDQSSSDRSKQKCFLYASLYPANRKIYTDYFVECCIVHGFLGDEDTKYSEMRRKAREEILRHLVNVAFLEEGEQMRYVKMNDFYRQFALYMSSKYPNSECRIYVDNEEHTEAFRSTSCQNATWVSMIGSKRDSLPPSQNCSSLQTLLLQKNLKLVPIPLTYFDRMTNLLVLNLYATKIKRLPYLSELKNLKAFYLNGCSKLLVTPYEIRSLEHIQVFDIRGTRVDFVPNLKCLRCLRISYISSGDYHGISMLHRLEELTIEMKSQPQWCNDAENIIHEVASLKKLTTFRCSFPSSKTLEIFLETSQSWGVNNQFTSFQFFVGCENSEHPKIIKSFDDRISKYVKYCNGEEKDDLPITKMLPQAEAFELICHKSVGTLLELVKTSNLEYLRGLLIEGCNQMSMVVAGDMVYNAINGASPENAGLLPNLEQLHLHNLKHVSTVFKGPLHPRSFYMLHTLTLKNCPELTNIFFATAIDNFPRLQKLEVQNCSLIKVLIGVKKVTEREQGEFPKLKMLVLDNLSKLELICPDKSLVWGCLEKLKVKKCPELKSLPFNTTNAANLRTIEGEKEWWSNLKWTHDEVRELFESAFSAST